MKLYLKENWQCFIFCELKINYIKVVTIFWDSITINLLFCKIHWKMSESIDNFYKSSLFKINITFLCIFGLWPLQSIKTRILILYAIWIEISVVVIPQVSSSILIRQILIFILYFCNRWCFWKRHSRISVKCFDVCVTSWSFTYLSRLTLIVLLLQIR